MKHETHFIQHMEPKLSIKTIAFDFQWVYIADTELRD